MLTTGSYNDGKRGFLGWNKELEKDLFEYADYLTANNVHLYYLMFINIKEM